MRQRSKKMPADVPAISSSVILALLWLVVKVGLLLLFGLYFLFSLIVVRQVKLMTQTLVTEFDPMIYAFSIVHSGLALAVIVLFLGFLLQG